MLKIIKDIKGLFKKEELDLGFTSKYTSEEIRNNFNNNDDSVLWDNSFKFIEGIKYYESLGYSGIKLKEAIESDDRYKNFGRIDIINLEDK